MEEEFRPTGGKDTSVEIAVLMQKTRADKKQQRQIDRSRIKGERRQDRSWQHKHEDKERERPAFKGIIAKDFSIMSS